MKYIWVLFLLFVSYSASAFQVKPMVSELKPSGSQSQQTFVVLNNSNESLTIDVEAYDLLVDVQGNENLKSNDKDFLIIPLTSIIPSGKSQSIIVRYIGEPVLKNSKSYRVAINQVAVDLGKGSGSGIGLSVSFKTLLNVVPEKAEASIVIKGKKQISKDVWSVSLENTGNKFARLSQSKWTIRNQQKDIVLEGKKLSQLLSGQIVLPKSSRTVRIKIPSEFNASNSDLDVVL